MAVSNINATAKFYEQAFGMKRVRESKLSIHLSDGVVNLAILDNQTNHEALGHQGLHHLGFIAEDVDQAAARAESNGAVYTDKPDNVTARRAVRESIMDNKAIPEAMRMEQRKYQDPNSVNFDIVNGEHARLSWRIPG
jgi:catechol 2,3-dioxygenase-like lactoylglutathione lyase family enzyme